MFSNVISHLYLDAEGLGAEVEHKLNQCTIALTRNCNLRCGFCYAKCKGYDSFASIDFEHLKQIVDFCEAASVKYVVLSGGEPTLHPDLIRLVKYIKSRKCGLIPTIATNGTTLDDLNVCKALVSAGIEYFDVSLKGCNATQFLRTTGVNLYPKQLAAITNLAALEVDFTCSMVLTPENINNFCVAVNAAKNKGARKFSFTFVIDNERSHEKDVDYLMSHNPMDLVESFVSHFDEVEQITDGEWWIEYSFPLCVYTARQLELLQGRLAAPCQIYERNAVTFDAEMNLLPCSMNIENNIGRFGLDFSTYKEFIDYQTSDRYSHAVTELSETPSRFCLTCKYLSRCCGGCTFFWWNCSFAAFRQFKESLGHKFVE